MAINWQYWHQSACRKRKVGGRREACNSLTLVAREGNRSAELVAREKNWSRELVALEKHWLQELVAREMNVNGSRKQFPTPLEKTLGQSLVFTNLKT